MVIWLMGISGSGKSTLANMLKKHLWQNGKKSYIIDGDIVREFFDNDLGYSRQERMENIKRIILAAHVLDQNDIVTIVANISPVEELRQFARQKINNYNQIYLNKSFVISKKNDVKGVYKEHLNKTEIVGVDITFEEPLNNDLVINVDEMQKEKSLDVIIQFLRYKYGGDFC